MHLYTDVCENTENIFEKILIEVGCQRGSKELILKVNIEQKIKNFLKTHKKYPNTLVLGLEESQYFKKDYKVVGSLGEITLLKLQKIDSQNALQVLYKEEN